MHVVAIVSIAGIPEIPGKPPSQASHASIQDRTQTSLPAMHPAENPRLAFQHSKPQPRAVGIVAGLAA